MLCNITSIMFWVAYGNAENQRALIDLPMFLPSMASIIRPKPGEQVSAPAQPSAVNCAARVRMLSCLLMMGRPVGKWGGGGGRRNSVAVVPLSHVLRQR